MYQVAISSLNIGACGINLIARSPIRTIRYTVVYDRNSFSQVTEMKEINLRSSGPAPKKSAITNAPNLVLVTNDGNCFMQGDANRTHAQHIGEAIISPERVVEWQDIIKRRHAEFATKGIPYIFLLGPDKQSIFWDDLCPERPDNRNSLAIFNKELNEITWIDPVPALKEANKTGSVSPLTDGHWDARGAYVAYRELISSVPGLATSILEEGHHFAFRMKETSGDLGNKLRPEKFSEANTLKRLKMRAKRIYANGVDRNGLCHIYSNPGLTTVGVLCGDSYSQLLAPFFAEHFGVLVHLRGSTDLNLISRLRPELVIGCLAERFFIAAPVSNDDAPIEMFFIRRLCRGEMKPEVYQRIRLELTDQNLPPPLLAMVARSDALGDMLISATPTERQRKYMKDQFSGATSGDVLTACYLAWAWQTPLAQSWADALSALPTAVKAEFRKLCPLE